MFNLLKKKTTPTNQPNKQKKTTNPSFSPKNPTKQNTKNPNKPMTKQKREKR